MQKYHLKKLFKLEGYVLDKIEYLEDKILLKCHMQKKYMVFKGERSKRINEKRERCIAHMMLEDKPVFIVIMQRRFNFPKHRTKRWERLPDVNHKKQTTNTFRLNTLRELKRDNYKGTGEKRCKSGMFASKILDELPIKLKWEKETTKVGLDGKSVSGKQMVHNITNLGENNIIGVLANLSQDRLKNFN